MKYLLFFVALAVGAQTPPPSSNAASLQGKLPCTLTRTTGCVTNVDSGGTVLGGGSGLGDVAGPAASVDSEVAIYSGTTGKLLKRFNGSGVLIGTSGVVSTDGGFQFTAATKALDLFGPLSLGQTSNYLGQLLLKGITSGTVTVQPANAAGTWTLTLPANDGDNLQVLQTNGSGVTSWAAAGTGNMVNTGTPTATAVPKYSDTTGTALAPSGLLIDANNDVTGVRNLTVTGTISAGAAGSMELTAITAPATPAAGKGAVYVDSTSKNLAVKDDAGVVKHGVQTATCTNQFASAITDAGGVTCATVTQATSDAALKRIGLGVAVGDPAGSALATGILGYIIAPKACTITGWDIIADAGTATIDIWKVASGTAKPAVGNTITASAKPALASGTALHSTTLTGWTTSVAAYDLIGFNLDAVATAKFINITVWCE